MWTVFFALVLHIYMFMIVFLLFIRGVEIRGAKKNFYSAVKHWHNIVKGNFTIFQCIDIFYSQPWRHLRVLSMITLLIETKTCDFFLFCFFFLTVETFLKPLNFSLLLAVWLLTPMGSCRSVKTKVCLLLNKPQWWQSGPDEAVLFIQSVSAAELPVGVFFFF